VFLAAASLAACSRPDATVVNYDIAVTALVDGNEVTRHAVYETRLLSPPPLGVPFIQYRTRGEAIRLPLEDGRVFYVLKRGRGQDSTVDFGFYAQNCIYDVAGTADFRTKMEAFQGPCEGLPPPEVVRFADERDPASLQVVRFTSFGPRCVNYCLRIVVQRSAEPVTTGIEKHLPWLTLGTGGSPIGTGEDAVALFPDKFYNIDFSTEIQWRKAGRSRGADDRFWRLAAPTHAPPHAHACSVHSAH
jgi:hypothetical protein